ncbi:MAG: TetR/AcrR family transcriptional regulator [Actinomycetes bacterium]|nr:TetR/AcrR family transcriptional regulator [Actinomycetes bacterium]MDX5449489.1 TetR/AcrR family transcriptional regulator [Actinomycetes bacterium]
MSPSGGGRQRILASALALFAERGTSAVTVRDIAAAADVSPALVLHHFGSKAGLEEAVDAHVAGVFDHLVETHDATDLLAPQGFADAMLAGLPEDSPVPAYVGRMLLDGGEAGHRLFAHWLDLSRALQSALDDAGATTPTSDPDTRAAFLLVNDLALVLLRDHLARSLGYDPLAAAGLRRWSAEALRAYSVGVFRKEHP